MFFICLPLLPAKRGVYRNNDIIMCFTVRDILNGNWWQRNSNVQLWFWIVVAGHALLHAAALCTIVLSRRKQNCIDGQDGYFLPPPLHIKTYQLVVIKQSEHVLRVVTCNLCCQRQKRKATCSTIKRYPLYQTLPFLFYFSFGFTTTTPGYLLREHLLISKTELT